MKKTAKILTPVLALILTLSLSVGCFAAVCIDYTFTAEIEGEKYTVLMGSADLTDNFDEIGVTVNGNDYKIEDSKLSHAQATKRFGIAFKGDNDSLTVATPYMKNGEEKIVGEEFAVDKTAAIPDAIVKETTPVIEFLDTDDRAKTTGSGLVQERIWADTTFGYNWLNFLKIDISTIKDTVDLTKNITLSLWGSMQPTRGDLAFMTIRTFMVPDSFDWETEAARRVDDSGYNFSKDDLLLNGEDYDTYVTGKTPICTVVKEFNEKKYSEFDINITPAVYQAIKNNEQYAYVILAPDCANVNTTRNAVFRYYIEGNEKISAPKIKYFEVDSTPSNAEISEITIADKKLTKADFVDGAYTCYLRAGESYPVVSATAEVEGAQVSVIPATAETKSATVNVVSKNGKNTATYTINFEKPTNTVQFFDGLIVNGFSNKLATKSDEDRVNYDDYYYYDITDSGRKSNAGNVVAVNTDDVYKISDSTGSSKNGPVLLQLDLSKLSYVDTTKPVMMNLYHSRDDAGAGNTVQLYDVTAANIDWAGLTTEYIGTTLYNDYISGKTPVATEIAFVNGAYVNDVYTESTPYDQRSSGCNVIDITAFVKKCIDENIMNPVVAVYPENKGYFRFSYNTSTTSFITYYQDYSYLSNAEISEVTIGTEKITSAEFVDGAYTCYIRTGEAYPEVTATPKIEGAQVTVTQASAEASYATVNVVSENGANTATYTINFAEPAKNIQFFNDFVINGYSNALSSTEKTNLDDYYYYSNTLSDSKKKSYANGIVLNTSDETAEFGSSGTTYNAPVLLQLDLSMLVNDHIDTSKPVVMNIYYSRYDGGINNRLQLFDVTSDVTSKVTVDGVADWTELSTTYLKTLLSGKTAFATADGFINGSFDENGNYTESTEAYNYKAAGCNVIDVTDFVKNCIDNGNLTPVVAVQLRDKGYTRFTYNTSTTSFISYYQDDSYLSNAEVSSFTIGDDVFTKEDLNDGSYTYNIKAGEAYPEVTAIAEIEGAQVTVTQASGDTNYATINVVSKNGKQSATYTINFVEFNLAETITPAISYLGSNSGCKQQSGNDYRFSISTYDNQITVNFLKIDISELKNKDYINENSRFTLNMRAKMQMNLIDASGTGLTEMTVKAISLPDTFNWETEAEDRASNAYTGTKDGSDYKNYVEGKTPVATGSLTFTDDFETVSLDISSVIYDAISGEGNYAYIALAGEPAEIKLNTNVKSCNFYYNTTAESYRTPPTLTLDAYDASKK